MRTLANQTDASAKTALTVAELQAKLSELTAKISAGEAMNSELQAIIARQREQIKLLTLRLYAPKRERSGYFVDGQMCFFNEIEQATDAAAEQEPEPEAGSEQEPQTVPVAAHERKKRPARLKLPDFLPVERIEYKLSPEECVCPECGGHMHEIGHETRETLKIAPAQVSKVEHVTFKYGCRRCEKENDHANIVRAPSPRPVIDRSLASPEAVAHIAAQKFVYGVPLYRQEQAFDRMGLDLSRQTMSNWLNKSARDWIEPVYMRLRQKALGCQVLHADETRVQVLKEDGKDAQDQSYMWLFRTSGDAERHIVLYRYSPTRSGDVAAKFLDRFAGYLHVDGYPAYQSKLPDSVVLVGCWAHCRRKFHEAVAALPKADQKKSAANVGYEYCDKMFELERTFSGLSKENGFLARHEARAKYLKPVMDKFFEWAEGLDGHTLPKSALGQATGYALNQRGKLEAVLLDGRLELSNNRAERSIKPFVIGRKNWLFCNTPSGAEASAIIYSLVETAKENGIDPYTYLAALLRAAPNSNEPVDSLLPWELCKASSR